MTENEAFYIIGNIPISLDDENYDRRVMKNEID